MIIIIGAGYVLAHFKILGDNANKVLTNLVMNLCLPCMIIKSMSGAFSIEELKNCGFLIIAAIITWGVTFALGQIVYIISGRTEYGQLLRFGMIYTNFTFVGVPVMEALYGDIGVFYFMVFLVPIRMVYYSTAEAFLAPRGFHSAKKTFLQKLKGWFSPPVVAVFIGLILYVTQLHLPTPITNVINSLGACSSPLGMLLCGVVLAGYNLKSLIKPKFIIFPIIRNILLPALFIGVCWLFKIPSVISQVLCVFATLPVASLIAAFTTKYNPHQETQFMSAACVLYSTVLSAVTIPLWSLVISHLFP